MDHNVLEENPKAYFLVSFLKFYEWGKSPFLNVKGNKWQKVLELKYSFEAQQIHSYFSKYRICQEHRWLQTRWGLLTFLLLQWMLFYIRFLLAFCLRYLLLNKTVDNILWQWVIGILYFFVIFTFLLILK